MFQRIPQSSKSVQILLAVACLISLSGLAGFIRSYRNTQPQAMAAGLSSPERKAALQEAYGRIPLSFEANQGQTDPTVKYLARGKGYSLFLTPQEAVLSLSTASSTPGAEEPVRGETVQPQSPSAASRLEAVLRMSILGANTKAQVTGEGELPCKSNYFVGNDPKQWRKGVSNFSRVKYREVYPGIDLVYYGNQGQLEYDFAIQPGIDPKQIILGFAGADQMRVDESGDLILDVAGKEIRQHKPYTYQETNGKREEVASRYTVLGPNEIGFELGTYDPTKPLVIDPVLVYSTYFGGSGFDTAPAVAVNSLGEAYLAGTTASLNFPGSPLQKAGPDVTDAFVVKINSAGNAVLYASYFGGDNWDFALGLAVDASGNAFVTGSTTSFNFPTAGTPFQSGKSGGNPLFKSTDAGNNFGAGVQGGSASGLTTANVSAIAVHPTDPSIVFATPFTGSSVYKSTDGGATWSFSGTGMPDDFMNDIAFNRANPTIMYAAAAGTSLLGGGGGVYRSVDGGSNWQLTSVTTQMNTVHSDSAGTIYAGGFDGRGVWKSTDGVSWTNLVIGDTQADGVADGFGFAVTNIQVDPANTSIIYLGTSGGGIWKSLDQGASYTQILNTPGYVSDHSVSIDSSNTVYAAINGLLQKGTSGGASWSVVPIPVTAGSYPTSTLIVGPTLYLGTSQNGVFKSGDGGANWSPTSLTANDIHGLVAAPSAPNIIFAEVLSGSDSYVAKLSPDGSSLVYSTYLGGGLAGGQFTADETAQAIAVDSTGNAYIVGRTSAANFPLQNPTQANLGGFIDAFIAKLNPTGSSLLFGTYAGGGANDLGRGIAVAPSGDIYVTGNTPSANFPVVNASQGTFGGGANDVFVIKFSASGPNYTTAYSTFMGGPNNDQGRSIAVDSSGNAYIAGQTNSGSGVSTAGAAQTTKAAGVDGFLVKLSPTGAKAYGTYIGGTSTLGTGGQSQDVANNVVVDQSGNAYVTGATRSNGFPVTNSLKTPNTTICGGFPCNDAFVTKLNSSGSSRIFSTLLGGDGEDQAFGIAMDSAGGIYISGFTSSAETLSGAPQGANAGGGDGFITKIAPISDVAVSVTDSPDPVSVNSNLTYTVTVSNSGEGDLTGVTLTDNLPLNMTFVSVTPSQGTCSGTSIINCSLGNLTAGQNATVTIVIKPTEESVITSSASVTCNQTEQNTANNTASTTTRATVGTVYTVNTNSGGYDGVCDANCTIRDAVHVANLNAGKDTILFAITGSTTIDLAGGLESLSGAVTIDATSQAGYAGSPIVELNGTGAGNSTGIHISSTAGGSTIRGLIVNRFNSQGISVDSSNNIIQGNYVGTNFNGTAVAPVLYSSVFLTGNNNLVGGSTPATRNVLSGNGHQGVAVAGSNNTIQGNYVGTNAAGTAALGGGGIFIFRGASNNLIGGPGATPIPAACVGPCNLISGNSGSVSISTFESAGATNNTIQGNFIGLNQSGTAAIPNSSGISFVGVSGNFITGNVVSGNNSDGIHLNASNSNTIQGNYIGVNAAGSAALGNLFSGISLFQSSNNQVGGTVPGTGNLISGSVNSHGISLSINTPAGLPIVDSTGNVIQGNLIGTNASGNAALGNKGSGISISGATGNSIGGTAPGAGNVISGNISNGISLSLNFANNTPYGANGNTVQGNFIGTNAAGTAGLANNTGINITGSSGNTIGGTTPAARNVIAGNTNNGISMGVNFVPFGPSPTTVVDASNNTVQGNYIGVKADGMSALPNTTNGVNLGGTANTIGGSTAGASNVIAFNNNFGVVVFCSQSSGAILRKCGTANSILTNSIHSNAGIGIAFGSLAGATPATANAGQVAPVLSFVKNTGANTSAQGSINSSPNTEFRLEFFANDVGDPSGAGEGHIFIGSAQVTTGATGTATFTASSLTAVPVGKIVSATATHPTNGTSRFSNSLIVGSTLASISGRATDFNGNAISGATITLSGGQSATATTDATGNYSFADLPADVSYTVAATLSGITFYPASFTLTNLPATRTVNFTKAEVKYTLTDLGALATGSTVSTGWDVNDAGSVAGWSNNGPSGAQRPFVYNGGTLTTLGTIQNGNAALAIAINSGGRVVGYSDIPTLVNGRGFFSDGSGALKEIGTFGGAASQAWGVNDSGHIVGQAQIANGQTRPFLWRDANNDALWQLSETLDLGAINGGTFGRAFDISNNGTVVGNSSNGAGGPQVSTLWRDDNNNGQADAGELRSLGNLGGLHSQAQGVNDAGYVSGISDLATLATNGRQQQRAFLWHDDNNNGQSDPGEMKNLGTLGGEFSSAVRINSANQLIGYSDAVGIGTPHAMLYRNNFMADLNAAIQQNLGWTLTEARGISDDGKITGYGTFNGQQRAYLLTPVLKTSQTIDFSALANKTYGNAPFTLSATASSGLSVSFSIVSGPATVSGNTLTITGAGVVTVRATQAGDATYDSATADQSFTVAPVLLRVIADSKTKVYGAPNPSFTVHYSGFVNNESASVLGGTLTFNTAWDNDPVGSYSITPSGLTSNNYTIQYLAATLTVDQASTTTVSGNYNLAVPGNVNLLAQVSPDAPSTLAVNGGTVTFVIRQGATTVGSVTSGAVSNGSASASFNVAGGGAYTVYASYSGTGNYFGSTGLASLTVGNANPVPSIIGLTPDSSVKKETENGQFTLLIDGNGFMSTSNGDPVSSTVDWYDRTTGLHTNLALTSINAGQIQAVVPYTLIRDGKTVEVSVNNAGPGGGTSNVQPFFVTDTNATVTSSETVVPDPVTGTASTTSVTPTGAILSAEASSGGAGGSGTLTVAQYSEDPIGTNASPNTSAFSTAEGGGYFDVYVAPGSSFTSLTLDYCNTGGTTLYWWNGTVWGLVSNQVYNPTTGCITVTVTTTSSPSIAQLTGTVFGVASGPAINSISISPSTTVALNSGPIMLNSSFVDACTDCGPYTAEINWGDGQTTNLNTVTGPLVTAQHTYTTAGTYSIKVKVARGTSFGTSTFSPMVVFNPAARFMTGGGWFNSPLGALTNNPAFTGKVMFESSVKYESGIPGGMTKVSLPGIDFVATQFSWLSITGTKVQVGGAGTINGASGYSFLLTGYDGKLDGKKLSDKLRVRLWEQSTGQIIYDNQAGAADDAAAVVALGGGNITIHK